MNKGFVWQGDSLYIEIYGQSHSSEIGVYINGLPSSFVPDEQKLAEFMSRRAPGKNEWSTPRKESDEVTIEELEQGYHGYIVNSDMHPRDYSSLANCPRPSHADYTGRLKYGEEAVKSGGGSFSGRMTAPLCIAGAMAKQILSDKGVNIYAHIKSIADIKDESFYTSGDIGRFISALPSVATKEFPVVDDALGSAMKDKILEAARDNDSVGGVIECVVAGFPGGVGGPLFEGLESKIASLAMAIPAAKGIEFGNGFEATSLLGSKNNDSFQIGKDGSLELRTNNCGGILGGISTGINNAPIVFDVAFKPTPSISKAQDTVDFATMKNTKIEIKGRHDPCICPRAVPVVEAVAAIALLDSLQMNR